MNNSPSILAENKLFKLFIMTLIINLLVRFIFAVWIPFTSDEAYYAIWGMNPSLGYYDHTPLIGWVLYLLLFFGKSEILLRLPSIVLPAIMASVSYAVFRHYDKQKALLISILLLIVPLDLAFVLISTDVPLILFSFLSGIFLFLSIKHNEHLGYYALSGICLGLAFFSKYFAVLLALAYICYFIATPKTPKRWLGFILLFICVLPFGLTNLYWNYTHGWANILFNVYNRNENAAIGWHNIIIYLAFLIYIVTPVIFYYLAKHYKQLFSKVTTLPEFAILKWLYLVPFLFFLLLSLIKNVGFHWLLSFVPFVLLSLFVYLDHQQIKRCIKFMLWFSGVQLLLLVIALSLPMQAWQHLGFQGEKYADLVYFFKHKEVRDSLNEYNKNFIFSSHSYAAADMMFYDSGQYAPTFGVGSVHGREGDFLTDFRPMNGKNFLIIDNSMPDLQFYMPYFSYVEIKTMTLDNATFYYMLGYDFNYAQYRNDILKTINQLYWQIPSFLPHTPTVYCEKYFSAEGCPSKSLHF
jgi:hypothetical protein